MRLAHLFVLRVDHCLCFLVFVSAIFVLCFYGLGRCLVLLETEGVLVSRSNFVDYVTREGWARCDIGTRLVL